MGSFWANRTIVEQLPRSAAIIRPISPRDQWNTHHQSGQAPPEPPAPDEKPRDHPMTTSKLSETDAIDLWIARWLRLRPKDIVARYDCDARRIYEVWEGRLYPASREAARARFERDYGALAGQTDFSPHRRISRARPDPEHQPDLFEWSKKSAA